jgi:superoxide dismutase, Fe-Mn family
MPIKLPPLPFETDALEPHISADTLEVHHGKHHKAYVDKTNELIAGTDLADAPLDEIVRAARDRGDGKLFNQAGQAWNHDFFWTSLRPPSRARPDGELAARIESDFGGFEAFADAFKTEAVGHFASGWCWLVADRGKLKVISTHDGDSALVHPVTPLLVLDLWEHAYYLDYQNKRPAFVAAFLENIANWEFAAANLARVRS